MIRRNIPFLAAFIVLLSMTIVSCNKEDVPAAVKPTVGNGQLTSEYDAAHTAWKGLWRLPSLEEMTLLKDGTTHLFADGGMFFPQTVKGFSCRLPAISAP